MMSGTRTSVEAVSLGKYDVEFPKYIIGEEGALHPLRRVSRSVAEGRSAVAHHGKPPQQRHGPSAVNESLTQPCLTTAGLAKE